MTGSTRTLALLAAGAVGIWGISQLRRGRPSFANKVILITGGSRGLGLELAREFNREGARVAICARDQEELERAQDLLREAGGSATLLQVDVRSPVQVQSMVAVVEDLLGPVDVVVNNAGAIVVGPATSMTRGDFELSLETTFWGAYNVTEAVLPSMLRRRQGRIVNISSIGGRVAMPHLAPYCVGKFALVGYSRALHAELRPAGVTVTTVCPGLLRTGSPRHAIFKGDHEAEYAWFTVLDSSPFLSVSSTSAARSIVEAARRGDTELVISLVARLAILVDTLLPELSSYLASRVARLLPDGQSRVALPGRALPRSATVQALAALDDAAALRNSQLDPAEKEALQAGGLTP